MVVYFVSDFDDAKVLSFWKLTKKKHKKHVYQHVFNVFSIVSHLFLEFYQPMSAQLQFFYKNIVFDLRWNVAQ